MNAKKFVLICGLTLGVLGLQSCGKKGSKITDAVQQLSEKGQVDDLLTNAEKLQKAEDELKNLPAFKGKELRVFQNVNFYGGQFSRIEIEVVNPDNGKDVDHYTYKNGQWEEPQPVQISGGGDMNANTTPLKDIKFAKVAEISKIWAEKAKEVEGAKPLDYVFFSLSIPCSGCKSGRSLL